jgi:hypothetical protein
MQSDLALKFCRLRSQLAKQAVMERPLMARAVIDVKKLDCSWLLLAGPSSSFLMLGLEIFRGAHDGLDREFKFFKRLEGGVCTTCAPGDQRKSCHYQREPAELTLCGVSGGPLFRQAANLHRSIAGEPIAE